ncbi:MAG: STAS domain-containing protein [Candidatus Omnitrophota bacterium]
MHGPIYKVETKQGVTILTLTKEDIPMYENERLNKAFSALLDEGKNNIVLDLSNAVYISSIVIASLVFMRKRAKESGGNFVICNIGDSVKEILATTNLDKVLDIVDDRQEAISQLAKKCQHSQKL